MNAPVHKHTHDCRSHSHSSVHSHDSTSPSTSLRKAKWAFWITFGFMGVEAFTGFFSGSLTLLGDALHMSLDSFSLGIAWVSLWITQKSLSSKASFVFRKAEVFGAFVSTLLLWFLCGSLFLEALERLHTPAPLLSTPVIVIGTVGLLINLLVLRVLHSHNHDDLSLRAAYLHVLGDSLGSAIAIASGILTAWKGWNWVDPVGTFALIAILAFSSIRLFKDCIRILTNPT